ncbi:MAG: exopolyphosphatase [Planctomycetes bacterium]|nr:exopolyphosphatase [Planctomycetota bacterium]
MVVARLLGDQLSILDRLRERVQLGAGLGEKKRLDEESQARALACLARFGERVRGMPFGSVRAVGTSALRIARNSTAFLEKASDVLGHRIEIISGQEEARLIYLGVAHDLAEGPHRRLVVDIGGGSTECILGERFEPIEADSLHMGCVNWSLRFFPRGEIDKERFERAVLAARLEVRSLERHYRALGWSECIGSSGTILSIEQVLHENGWNGNGISEKGLRKLKKEVLEAGRCDKLMFKGLAEERRGVFPGGLAILIALFEGLGIESLNGSLGALREGVLWDLVGRIRHVDLREQTIRRMGERYSIDLVQSGRVQRTALDLLRQCGDEWELPREASASFLAWAARLHEIGLSISHQGYQKHGAYIVANSDMPGFSRQDQQLLAALIQDHRRKLEQEPIERLPAALRRTALRLVLLLRIAVLLNRSRGAQPAPPVALRTRKTGYMLAFPEGWLEQNPLSQADLYEERERLQAIGYELELR